MTFFIATLATDITDAVAEVADALLYPVLVLALFAALVDIYEFGRLAVEWMRRRQKNTDNFDNVARQALATAQAGDVGGAQALLRTQAYGEHLETAYIRTLLSPTALDAERAAIDYDLYASRRLDRLRLLVRSGPALGLMGTLIPLASALSALGRGDVKVLSDELQTAFAITVIGVGVGLAAFAIALVHERYFSRDLANIEFLRQLRGDAPVAAVMAAPGSADARDHAPGTVAATAVAPAARATATPAAPQVPTAPAAPAPQAPAAPPAQPPIYPPSAPAQPEKKKFGLKRKTKSGEAAGYAPPPAAPVYPQPPAGDKAPTIPPPPQPGGQGPDDGDKSASIPTPPNP